MSEKTKSILKPIAIILAVLAVITCLGVDVWNMWLLNYAPTKLVSNTTYIGMQEATDGTIAPAFKVKWNSNKNKNGHEVFSLSFNYLRDEKASGIYSQGVQYETNNTGELLDWYEWEDYTADINKVGDNVKALIELNNKVYNNGFLTEHSLHTSAKGLWKGYYSATYVSPKVLNGAKHNYQFVGDGIVTGSTNPISNDSYFTFQTVQGSSDDMLYLQFRGDSYAKYSKGKIEADVSTLDRIEYDTLIETAYNYYYNSFDIDWFANIVYHSVQALKPGIHNVKLPLEFGNNFRLYSVNAEGSVGTEIGAENSTKVQNIFRNYFVFEVEVTADGARASSDTLFGQLHGSPSYKVDGYTGENGDYFTGEHIIDVTYKAFDFVKLTDTDVALKLKKEFLNAHLPYKKEISLNIKIDLSETGYNFVGFTEDSGLENFKIFKSEVVA